MEVQFFGAHTLYTKIRREWYCAYPIPITSPRLTPDGDVASCVCCREQLTDEEKESVRGIILQLLRHLLAQVLTYRRLD
jgi:hypothetical protein